MVEGIHDGVKAPMYWSVYEYCMMQNAAGVNNNDMDLTSDQWDEIVDWVATELKPHGYDMICTDGFIPMLAKDESGYMTHYGSQALKDIVEKCKAKGLKLGVYDNPLWIHGPKETKIEGTGYTFAASNKDVFTWEGQLTEGTFKMSEEKDFNAPFYRPSSANVTVDASGVSASDMVFTASPDDQWKVTEAGTYQITIDINNKTIKVVKK